MFADFFLLQEEERIKRFMFAKVLFISLVRQRHDREVHGDDTET